MRYDVAIIGAGPIGMVAALHLQDRGLSTRVFEQSPSLFSSIRGWGHVRMFSSWSHNIESLSKSKMLELGWEPPSGCGHPTGLEFIEQYLEPMARLCSLEAIVSLGHSVEGVSRIGIDKLRNDARNSTDFHLMGSDVNGGEWECFAGSVIDCSGTWGQPNNAGSNGLPAIGERVANSNIEYGMPDVESDPRRRYANKTTAVVGAGHSAIGTLLSLARIKEMAPETSVHWIMRGDDLSRTLGGGAKDELKDRGKLGTQIAQLIQDGRVNLHKEFCLGRIDKIGDRLQVATSSGPEPKSIAIDNLIVCTGFSPGNDFLREIRLDLDPAIECTSALAPLIDPNVHLCGSVRPHGAAELEHLDEGFFTAGMKSYGRAPTFLLMTGYEQVRSICAHISGDHEGAIPLIVDAPGTGVCSSDAVYEEFAS